jgi:hypothetical protein
LPAVNKIRKLPEWLIRVTRIGRVGFLRPESPRPQVEGSGRRKSTDKDHGPVPETALSLAWCHPCRGLARDVIHDVTDADKSHLALGLSGVHQIGYARLEQIRVLPAREVTPVYNCN